MPRYSPFVVALLLVTACTGSIGDAPDVIVRDVAEDPPAFPFEPTRPSIYVSKVKNVLTGTPATEDEVAMVTRDPAALRQLVAEWIDRADAQRNLRGFYANVFQQSQAMSADLSAVLGRAGRPNMPEAFVRQLRDSFPISVEHMVREGQPFTRTVTTDTVWMTPPIMAYYLLADQFVIADDGGRSQRYPTSDGKLRAWFDYHDPEDTAGAWTNDESLTPGNPHFMHFMMSTKLTCTYGLRTYAAGHDKNMAFATPVMDPTDPTGERVQTATIEIPSVIYDPTNVSPVTGKAAPLGALPEEALWVFLTRGVIAVSTTAQSWSRGGFIPDSLRPPAGISAKAVPSYRTTCVSGWKSGTDLVIDFTPGSADTEFRAVRIVPSTTGDSVPFWDLRALRDPRKDTLELRVPRLGFFSTPAFLSTFPNNPSNDARGITNQALIAAIGLSINPVDKGGTTVLDTGEDADHSASNSACYACHQALDPMRNVFKKTWSYAGSEQGDEDKKAVVATFDYQGLSRPMASLTDFARALVEHPLYARAIVQKLCYYASSAPCSEDDPEILRIVDVFAQRYDFRELVIELLSSPVITGASESKTLGDRGEIVSIARYSQLCASLTRRTGLAEVMGDPAYDVCSGKGPAALDRTTLRMIATRVPFIAANIPTDGFARGAEDPLLPTEPTMFIRGSVESLCEVVGLSTVDLPGSRYASSTHHAAITDMVDNVMGLVGGDPAHDFAIAVLTEHFDGARAAGATPTEALRSVFTLACTSPTAMSVGL